MNKPKNSRRNKQKQTASFLSNIWIKLLIIATLIISLLQLLQHSNHRTHNEPGTKKDGVSGLAPKEKTTVDPYSSMILPPLEPQLDSQFQAEMIQIQNQLISSEQRAQSYKKQLEELQRSAESNTPIPNRNNIVPNTLPQILSKGVHDEGYRVRASDCAVILKQRKAITTVSEADYAFIKYDRGKVPFNTEWSVCDLKESAISTVHCMDSWLLGHCRGAVLDDYLKWSDWLNEVAVVYEDANNLLLESSSPLRYSAEKNGYYLAACLHNNAILLKNGYIDNLVALAKNLRDRVESDVFVSIYENDSTDTTKALLKELDSALEAAHIPHLVLSEQRGASVEKDRIDKLSFARNKALEPLKTKLKWGAGAWVLFLNDISFHAADMLQLLDSQIPYDLMCGVDHQTASSTELYDVWVNRDLDGHPLSRQAPHYSHPLDQVLFEAAQPVPVSCCWNGAVAVKAEVFTDASPVRFRRPLSNETGSCDESECTTFCRDLYSRGFHRIYVNPRVHVSYAYPTGHKAASGVVSPQSQLVPKWAHLAIAVARAERYPLGMSCCSLWNGANFAPKLGLFVGCHHLEQSSLARSAIHRANQNIRNKLALFTVQGPRPGFVLLKTGVHGASKKGKRFRGSEDTVEGSQKIQVSDMASEASLIFNRRARCKSVFSVQQTGNAVNLGGVVDISDGSRDKAVVIPRLVTVEDTWMVAPIPSAQSLFGTHSICSRERETYRMSAGVAFRASYGPDMLLVSDKFQFICVVVWKVASRTLLSALMNKETFNARKIDSHNLSAEQQGYTVFSFVRDPLTRYISGYFSTMKWVKMKRHKPCVEALTKAHKQEGDSVSFLTDGDIDQAAEQEGHPGEPGRFQDFTQRLLGGSGIAFPGVQHIFSQASFLSVTDQNGSPLFRRVHFIGKLETLAEDWVRLMSLLGSRPGLPRPPVIDMPHRNSAPTTLTALLKGTLLNNTDLLKKVCKFYIQDFQCFGYTLPPDCAPPPKK